MIAYFLRRARNCASRLGWASVMSTGSSARPLVGLTAKRLPDRERPTLPAGSHRPTAGARPHPPAGGSACCLHPRRLGRLSKIRRCGSAGCPRPAGEGSAGCPCLRRRLHLLLVRPHASEGVQVGDVRDGLVRAVLAVLSRRLPPARRRHAVLLAEQRDEDLRLLGAEA